MNGTVKVDIREEKWFTDTQLKNTEIYTNLLKRKTRPFDCIGYQFKAFFYNLKIFLYME